MSGHRTVDNMLLVGGNVVLDFVNTVDVRNAGSSPDYLNAYRDLIVFAKRTDLFAGIDLAPLEVESRDHPRKAATCLVRARELRELFYRLSRAEFANETISEDDVADFSKSVLAAMKNRVLIATASELDYKWRSMEDLDVIGDALVLVAHDFFIKSDGRRPIRECPGRNCGWLFLDTSKGGKRRWCSDKSCGTTARVLKFRAVATN